MSDLIRRSDAINELAKYLMLDAQKEWAGTASEDIEDWKELAETVFDDIPSAEPKQGKWIDNGDCEYLCSECGMSLLFEPHYNFCPNCGCRMKGADDED